MTTNEPQTPQEGDHLHVDWTSKTLTQVVLFWLIAIGVVMGVLSSFRPEGFDWQSLLGNLSTELIGAAITFLILEWVIGRKREEEKEVEDTEELKARLIREMGSRVHDVAINATEELRRRHWLFDGSLRYKDFRGADLRNADLRGADLRDTVLAGAKMQGVHLWEASLEGAIISDDSFNENTTLPDGDKWTPDIDMGRYTDPSDADFYSPSWVKKQQVQ